MKTVVENMYLGFRYWKNVFFKYATFNYAFKVKVNNFLLEAWT